MNRPFPGSDSLLIAALWPPLGLALISIHASAARPPDAASLILNLATWLEWSLLTFPIVYAARAIHRSDAGVLESIGRHLLAILATVAAHLTMYLFLRSILMPPPELPWFALAVARIPRHLVFGLCFYAAIAKATQAIDAYRAAVRSEVAAVEMRSHVLALELEGFQRRLEPPRLFADLAEISAQLHTNLEGAEASLYRLGAQLRTSLHEAREAPLLRAAEVERFPQTGLRTASLIAAMAFPLFGLFANLLLAIGQSEGRSSFASPELEKMRFWLIAGLFSPLLIFVCTKIQRMSRDLRSQAPLLVASCAVHATLPGLVLFAWDRLQGSAVSLPAAVFGEPFTLTLLLTLATVYLMQSVTYRRRYEDAVLAEARLANRLLDARCQTLRLQLRPHFLFNALNSILTLMHRDRAGAEEMLQRLRTLLQLSLGTEAKQEVALRAELEIVASYVAIEHVRFGDRLRVTVDVPAELLESAVPSFMLQPIVENAVRHGIAPRSAGGTIELFVRREKGSLLIEVRDDGTGLADEYREGVGLTNLRARLEQLYGVAQRCVIEAAQPQGTSVRVRIPLAFVPAPGGGFAG